MRQSTLRSSISCVGVGLHSGEKVTIRLIPAPADTGIVFIRTDQPAAKASIPATWNRVTDTRLCTKISNSYGVSVGTIEHLMAAFRGCEVDNAFVEIDGAEVPIMDGSAAQFVFLIECAGITKLDVPRRFIRILKDVEVRDGEKFAAFHPAENSVFSCDIDFHNKAIPKQTAVAYLSSDHFKTAISRARTFGFLHEVEYLRSIGLARGGSLDNAVVIDGDKIVNEDGLRYGDEFVRHKMLDSIGDVFLAGSFIKGHFHGHLSGHELNNKLLRTLFADPHAWCIEAAANPLVPANLSIEETLPPAGLLYISAGSQTEAAAGLQGR